VCVCVCVCHDSISYFILNSIKLLKLHLFDMNLISFPGIFI